MTRTTKARFALYADRTLHHAGYAFNSAVRAGLLGLAVLGECITRCALAAEHWFAEQCRSNSRARRPLRPGMPPWGKRVEDTRGEWRVIQKMFTN